MKANETPILSIDNLRSVLWRYESFVRNLRFNSDITVRICHDQMSDIEFKNVSHRAIKEIENLYLNVKIDLVDSYFSQFKRLNDKLKLVIDRLEDKSHANLINIAKIEIDNVFYYLNLYNSRYNEQRTVTHTKPILNPFKDGETKDLFEYIIQNWEYNAMTKWGYVWNYFFDKGNGKMTSRTDYEGYLIQRGLITKGKPNYENCNSQKRYDALDQLKKEHLEI